MELFTLLLLLIGLQASSVFSQSALQEQILGSVIYTMYGDRTPFILPQAPTLTPLGAQQLFSAGSIFRNRYLVSSNESSFLTTAIAGIAPYILDNTEISVYSTSDEYIVASSSAFMQGLYPPLGDSTQSTFSTELSMLANGTNVQAPLNGYQYPQLYTSSPLDVNSIWVAGMSNCPMYTASINEYWESPEYESLLEENVDFYASLVPTVFEGVFPNVSVGYFDAYDLWDYANYAVIHNSTVADTMFDVDLTRLQILADDWVFALNGNISASGLTQGDHIRAIGGRTLATRILESLYTNINTEGQNNKMTLFFGSFEPMVSLAALMDLPSPQNEQFYSIPEMGASMVFELLTLVSSDTGSYPVDETNLFVRFLYQNGTGSDSELVAYPLFGLDPDQTMISLEDFVAGLEAVMILSIEDWCTTCASFSVFCPAFEGNDGSPSNPNTSTSPGRRLNPVVAGVIGAMVTLVVLSLIVGAAMLLLGLRFFRVKSKRRSELAGFKGAEKLASDQDLSIPKGGAGAVVTEGGAQPVRGHERVGSWELSDSAKAEQAQRPIDKAAGGAGRRPSYEEDDVTPYSVPVKPIDHV